MLRTALVALRRPPDLGRPAPAPLGRRWAEAVAQAAEAERRFGVVVASTLPGPMRERLEEVAGAVATTAAEVRRVARIGNAADPGGRGRTPAATRVDQLIAALESAVVTAGELAVGDDPGLDREVDAELSALRAALEDAAGET